MAPGVDTLHGRKKYLRISLFSSKGGHGPVREYAHRLVCWVWNGPPLGDKTVARHTDRVLAPHHKNDRRSNKISSGPIDVLIPPGPLTDLLVFWLEEAWGVVHDGTSCSTAFSSRGGRSLNPKPFSPTNFSDYWTQLVHTTAPKCLATLTATMARTSFVEAYTKGTEEREWEGAAAVMGNSVGTWRQHYSTVFKRRSMQQATDSFSAFLDRDESASGGSGSGEGALAGTATDGSASAGTSMRNHQLHLASPILPKSLRVKKVKRALSQMDGEQVEDGHGGWVGWGAW
jgi:hypothetical protein